MGLILYWHCLVKRECLLLFKDFIFPSVEPDMNIKVRIPKTHRELLKLPSYDL